jgi:hypothetical protein
MRATRHSRCRWSRSSGPNSRSRKSVAGTRWASPRRVWRRNPIRWDKDSRSRACCHSYPRSCRSSGLPRPPRRCLQGRWDRPCRCGPCRRSTRAAGRWPHTRACRRSRPRSSRNTPHLETCIPPNNESPRRHPSCTVGRRDRRHNAGSVRSCRRLHRTGCCRCCRSWPDKDHHRCCAVRAAPRWGHCQTLAPAPNLATQLPSERPSMRSLCRRHCNRRSMSERIPPIPGRQGSPDGTEVPSGG